MAKDKNKSTHVEVESKNNRDDVLSSLADVLNKSNKDGGTPAYFLDDKENASEITDWISTGSTLLDLAISNRPYGGLPVQRIVEINGLESSGKSLMSAHIIANTQKKGGKAIMIDTENSAAPEFWKSLGVDLSKLLYLPRETVEDIFDTIEAAILYVRRKENNNDILTIIVDSIAAASTKKEMETDHSNTGFNTAKSIIVSKAMRKITNMIGREKVLIVFTNQLRQNLKAMAFSDPWIVPGGKAVAYHSSIRIRLNNAGKLKKGEEIIGNKCKAEVKKTRFGPGGRKAEFEMHYNSGIADYASWFQILKDNEIIKQSGQSYKYTTDANEEIQFKSNDFVFKMNSDEKLKNELYGKICNAVIMKYKEPNSVIEEDLTISEVTSEEDENN